MFQITVKTDYGEKTLEFTDRILLSDALIALGVDIPMSCGGKGICGSCRVSASGIMYPDTNAPIVSACKTYAVGDTVIDMTKKTGSMRIVTDGSEPSYTHEPLVSSGFGAAVDIGTTTVAVYIYEYPSGRLVEKLSAVNPQSIHGADVVSRIEYAANGGLTELHREITELIASMTAKYDIQKYVICGNTVMLHLYTDFNPSSMAYSPFTPQSLFGITIGKLCIPRCISAYVGADITCAVLASGMLNNKTALLADIGTNGEIVLKHEDRIICCSVSAGPALEGGNISCGTAALSGAVDRVYLAGRELKYTTIDSKPPIGICGSGLVDAISCMKRLGKINENGGVEADFEICENVCITKEDVRAYLMAKAAVRAGIDTLLHYLGITYNEVEALYIAGGFGSYINKYSASATGLIPSQLMGKTRTIGNAAATGASMILNSREQLKIAEKTAVFAKTIELASSDFFAEKFIENMKLN